VIVTVNGESRDVAPGVTVAGVVELLDVPPDARGVAVAVDGEVVTRARWSDTSLRDGAQIEVVAAIQGG
jgi:sulfur carrier protein